MTVTTKEELAAAKKAKVESIIVEGELADKLVRSKKVAKLSAASLAIITAAVAGGVVLAPVTMGTSLGVTSVGLVAAAATTGTSVAAIIAASSIGIALIVAVYKDYRVIEARAGFISLSLKK